MDHTCSVEIGLKGEFDEHFQTMPVELASINKEIVAVDKHYLRE